MALDLEPARVPTSVERELVEFLLSPEFRGVETLRAQGVTMTVASNCDCGCGSVSIYVDPALAAAESPNTILNAWDDERAIEALLIVDGGRLSGLEVTHYKTEPTGLPEISRLSLN